MPMPFAARGKTGRVARGPHARDCAAARASLQNTRPRVRPRAERRMLRKASIPALRQQIDRIDDQLLRLLNRRAALALAVAEQKAQSNSQVYAPAREKAVL